VSRNGVSCPSDGHFVLDSIVIIDDNDECNVEAVIEDIDDINVDGSDNCNA
jgi:hypothetical protein